MKKVFLYLFLVYCFTNACSNNEKRQEQTILSIPVSTSQITSETNYSDFLEDIKAIKLETKDSLNVLQEVDKVMIDDDKVFVLDMFRFRGVMAFDTSGKFLFSLKAGGGAEGEFSHLSGMSIDTKRKELIIYSTPNVLHYSYDGRFIKKKTFDLLGTNFETNGDINAFIGQDYGLIVTDTAGKVIYKLFEKSKIYNLKFLQPFQVHKRGILFRHSLNDTIYLANKQGLTPHTIIDFQDKKLTAENIENMIKNDIKELPNGKMGRIKYFFDTENVVYFAFEYNQMLYVSFYDKRTKTTKIIRGNAKNQNDITLEETLPYVVGVHENNLIAVIFAERTHLDLPKLRPNKYSIKVLKSFQNKGDSNIPHNPNLILMKLK
jgi:aromatic ring-cleaving dioxygenase